MPKSRLNFDPSLDFIFYFLTVASCVLEVVIILDETKKNLDFVWIF